VFRFNRSNQVPIHDNSLYGDLRPRQARPRHGTLRPRREGYPGNHIDDATGQFQKRETGDGAMVRASTGWLLGVNRATLLTTAEA
jgi:hypothetical protein